MKTKAYISIEPGVMEQTIFIGRNQDIRAPMKKYTCPINQIATFLLSQKNYVEEVHMTESPFAHRIEREMREKASSFNNNADIKFIYSKEAY